MNEKIILAIAKSLNIKPNQVRNTLKLMEEGATVPFIARYRKELTEGLDEEAIRVIEENYTYQVNLAKRKEDVLRLIDTLGKLDDNLRKEIEACEKLTQVEDLYRPYQQKRKTRASEAIKKGLQPLADYLLSMPTQGDIVSVASKYVNDEVKSVEDALQGAKDIIAEMASDHPKIYERMRSNMRRQGKIVTVEKKQHNDEKKVYGKYYDYQERLSTLAPHRVMAMDRGEKEKVLTVSIEHPYVERDIQYAIEYMCSHCDGISRPYIEDAVRDGMKRLCIPSVEREIRKELSEQAHEQSIGVFSTNLEKLLMQPPMSKRWILGFDPGFRTGCKLAVIDEMGKLHKIAVIYPHPPVKKDRDAKRIVLDLLKTYPIRIIAIGNGTASRESEAFIANLIQEYQLDVSFTLVSEAGASVYSASKLARDEFPDLAVEERSAVSIARRILDPLSELIKIDPRSIGVGQYQHDLPNVRLKERLEFVVSKAVNRVGVNVNTAGVELLKNVAGLSSATAKNIVAYREEHGEITRRDQLLSIPKIGLKSYTQAAGFLRITDGEEPLDATSIHPESYPLAKQILSDFGLSISQLGTDECEAALQELNVKALCEKYQCDSYTLEDIIDCIKRPLRDYRDQYDAPLLRSDILEITDLKVGDSLEGVVRNVVDFGAFIDIGLHEDGLCHVSSMSRLRKKPYEIVSVGDVVKVWVKEINLEREKVQLSLIPLKN
ncbi:MAG: Tex family protein [Longicatena sp.]|nr:Tex family protein [Longicatena sp.]